MSGSYRLQTSRPRPPPAPLRFEQPSFKSSSVPLDSQQASPTLLYDLPSPTSMTPPTSPRSKGLRVSPTSPSFHSRLKPGASTPPPYARNRSTTPSGVAPNELETFADHCRSWYFSQNEESGRIMTQTLATLLPSQRAPFSRLQASIRSAYHRSVNVRRNAECQAHLAATQPGGSLMPHSRADPQGNLARKERYERVGRFVRSWCTMGMPGTIPFFEAFWAVLRLQVIPEELGGSGGYRIEWEFDDAVFKEAAGKDFMLEAIDILKGVLAFEEAFSSKSSAPDSHDPHTSIAHLRSKSQPLPYNQKPDSAGVIIQPKRGRAPSNPFLDAPALLRSAAFTVSPASGKTSTMIGTSTPEEDLHGHHSGFDESDEHLRIWTSPDLTNTELLELLKVFPAFISRRPLPRFPISVARQADIEEGHEGEEGKRINFGTGSLWVSSKQRTDGWKGGWWSRFILWWRRLFC